MSTSGSTNYSTDRNTLIAGALRLIGAIAQGETPTATQYTEGAEALNMMVKAWQADGMPLWAIKEYNITPVADTRVYRIGLSQTVNTPRPLKIIGAYFHDDTSDVDIPMTVLTRQEYNSMGVKTITSSTISQYYYDIQSTYGDLYVYPVPNSTAATAGNYIRIVYQRPYEDFDASTDEPDFPQEWYDALKFGLACRLAPEYGVPLEQYGMLLKQAKEIKQEALNFGTEETSIYFEPDKRPW